MYTRAIYLAAVILCTSFSGCAGTSNSGAKKQIFNKTLGLCGRDDFLETINTVVFLKNHYLDSGDTRDLGSRIEITTEWRPRFVFPDEQALGIIAAESKLVIFAKFRHGQARSLRGEPAYYASFRAENRVKYQERGPWQNGPITNDAKAHFNDIVDDMIQELKSPY